MLEKIADGIWTRRVPLVFMGLHLGARVTIVKLPGGGLWVHSPIALEDGLKTAVDALGTVEHIVAPNLMHHLWVGDWKAAWPNAQITAPGGLAKKRKDLSIDHDADTGPHPAWGGVFETFKLEGMPRFAEVYFVHGPTKTLVTADLVLAIEAGVPSWMTRMYLKMIGLTDKPLGCSVVHKIETKDKAAVRRSIDRLVTADWTRLVVSHGVVIERPDVRDLVAESYSWLPAS